EIDRYLNGQLSGQDAAAFEIRMMEDPALLERVQLLESLKQGLSDEQQALLKDNSSKVLPFRAWLRQPLSLAASLLVAVLGLQSLYPDQDQAPVVLDVGSVLLVEGTRGASPLNFVGSAPYLFQVDAGPAAAGTRFDLNLRDSTGTLLFAREGLPADDDGWVRLLFAGSLNGSYTLELASTDGRLQTHEIVVAP